MDYIRYHELEHLFRKRPILEAILESLNAELKYLKSDDESEYIENAVLGGKQSDINIKSNKISDKTFSVASSYRNSMKKDYNKTRKNVLSEITAITFVLDKLDIAFRKIPFIQQEILKMYYWDEKTWDEVVELLKPKRSYISKCQAQRYRKLGIEKLRTICKIDIDSYEQVIEFLEK